MVLPPLGKSDGADIIPIVIMIIMIGGGAIMNWIASIGKAKRTNPGGTRAAPPPMAQPRRGMASEVGPSQRMTEIGPSQRMSEVGPSNLPDDAMTTLRRTMESASQGRGAQQQVLIAAAAGRARAAEEQKRLAKLARRKAEEKALQKKEDDLADLTAQRIFLERGDIPPDAPSERVDSSMTSERAPRASGMASAQRKRGVGFAFFQKLSEAQRLVVAAEVLVPRGRSPLRRMDKNAGRPSARPHGQNHPPR